MACWWGQHRLALSTPRRAGRCRVDRVRPDGPDPPEPPTRRPTRGPNVVDFYRPTGYTIKLSHVKQRVDRYCDRYAAGALGRSLLQILDELAALLLLLDAREDHLRACVWRVSESPRTINNAGVAPLMNFFGTFSQASMASSSQVTSAFLKAPE